MEFGRVERSGKMSRKVESCRVTSSQVVHVVLELFPEYAAITQVHPTSRMPCSRETARQAQRVFRITTLFQPNSPRSMPPNFLQYSPALQGKSNASKRKRGRMCNWVVGIIVVVGLYGVVKPNPIQSKLPKRVSRNQYG